MTTLLDGNPGRYVQFVWTAPGAPSAVTAVAGNTQATISFTAPVTGGSPVALYTVTSSPGNIQATGVASPITYPPGSLTNTVAYTFSVIAMSVMGTGAASAPSNSVTPSAGGGGATVPVAPTIGTAVPGNTSASVAFTANGDGGSPITGFTAISSPGAITASGSASPISYPAGSFVNGTNYSFTVHATNAIGNSAESAASNSVTPIAKLFMYSNGVVDTTNFPNANDVSFNITQNTAYATNPKPGHTLSWQGSCGTFGGALQRSSNWGNIPPAGFDASPYTWVEFWIKIHSSAGLYLSGHYTRSTGDDIAISTSVTQGSACFAGITPDTWSYVGPIPLSSLGHLSSFNLYKTNWPGSNVTGDVFQVDDQAWIPGNTGWIFRGRLTGLESGWTDASTATVNYSFLPQTLGANCYSINNPPAKASVFTGSVTSGTLNVTSVASGAIAIGDALFYDSAVKGTITGGSGTTWTITGSPGNRASTAMGSAPPATAIRAVKMTPAGAGQQWKVTHAGFDVTPYTYFTIGIIPTNSVSSFQLRFYNPAGVAVGTAVTLSTAHTQHNFGLGTTWTVYNVPLSAAGAIGSSIGGVSIQESAGSVWYHGADGFFS
jgi:hypothetical protein